MSVDVSAVSGSGLYANNSQAAAAPKKELDSETFLNLLVAQLKYQDPSSPMNTNEMMAQTTQLASMEQLTALATTTTENFALSMRNTAADLVGRTVTYVNADGETMTGTVNSVRYDGAVPTVIVDEAHIPLDAVASVVAAN
ncbi:flagellar hook assembly protein FlgD [Timonella sp. A28]|uniref:flagellar hook assembly protein FlgD n=1 Tax=Timonella sp. A28 TaxID=3442640 RepID=UPI003EBA8034